MLGSTWATFHPKIPIMGTCHLLLVLEKTRSWDTFTWDKTGPYATQYDSFIRNLPQPLMRKIGAYKVHVYY